VTTLVVTTDSREDVTGWNLVIRILRPVKVSDDFPARSTTDSLVPGNSTLRQP